MTALLSLSKGRILGCDEMEVAVRCGGGKIGHLAAVDAMRGGNDSARRRLAEDLGQPHHRECLRAYQIGEDLAGPHRGQLIVVSHHQHGRPCGDRLDQSMHQRHVDHRGFVDDQQIAVQLVLGAAVEGPRSGIDLQQAVDRLRFEPGGLAQPLGRPPS